jgi:putative N6-adenine-specific DNA methylase
VTSVQLFAQCGPGLEPALAAELVELGLPGRPTPGGVEVHGAPALSWQRLNLWSRVAERVLLRVATVRTPAELGRVRLGDYGAAFALEASGQGAQPFRDAAARAFPLAPDGLPLLLRLDARACTVSVDTTGELLHFRGYRQEIGRAPLRETLAAGVLRLAGWQPAEPLLDVMCGSGTLLIEAAECALGLAPGRARRFAFEAFPSHDAAAFAALARQGPSVTPVLAGSDLNAGALGTARRNAKRAGVLEHLTLERVDATALAPRGPGPGLVIANLPYGKRVGQRGELGALYRRLGASVRRACPGWRFAFLLEGGAEHLGLLIDETHAVSNGGLRCELVTGRVGP